MKKRNLVISWILRIILAALFLLASLGKITNNVEVIKMFENWGFPDGFHFIIGILELGLAILLIIPKTLKIGIIGLSLIMLGAIATHLINDPINQTVRPIIFIILLSGIFFINYPLKSKGIK